MKEEYKKSLTHKYYLDKNLKDPELQKMIDKNKNKSLNAFRFEARLFYYGFFISILFGFIFTITGVYKDEFISSLYPYIEPYFKVFYHNFEKYTFNTQSFKVSFSWIFVFSVLMCIIIVVYCIINPKNIILMLKQIQSKVKVKLVSIILMIIGNYAITSFFNKVNIYSGKRIFFGFPISYGMYYYGIALYIICTIFIIICLISLIKGKLNAN
ncbi:hypothetical protein CRU98_00860 [Arcobacter sp. CECT 8986]|uniref:hypothetical protein n=1 Tax=Arcobacter sp. CECT 8986 TaxID=2044507 RepID=UPI001009B00B|nr:hypothetical protein [Arcobacter sp. CECT 8986]RXK01035.1 hypothetical protein CRU98_00860 [Arcobacter sp. CECT 8986]